MPGAAKKVRQRVGCGRAVSHVVNWQDRSGRGAAGGCEGALLQGQQCPGPTAPWGMCICGRRSPGTVLTHTPVNTRAYAGAPVPVRGGLGGRWLLHSGDTAAACGGGQRGGTGGGGDGRGAWAGGEGSRGAPVLGVCVCVCVKGWVQVWFWC